MSFPGTLGRSPPSLLLPSERRIATGSRRVTTERSEPTDEKQTIPELLAEGVTDYYKRLISGGVPHELAAQLVRDYHAEQVQALTWNRPAEDLAGSIARGIVRAQRSPYAT